MNMNEENHNKSPFSYAKRTDTAELRMQVPRRLLEVFDAVSMARGQERFELVIEELSKSADRWVHEAILIQRVTRGNTSLSETDGASHG